MSSSWNALAFTSAIGRVVAAGGAENLTLISADTLTHTHWEWVTDVAHGWGGPIDDVITALAFAPDGTLYIGNPTCLNVLFPNGSITRVSASQGAPAGNITAIAMEDRVGAWPEREGTSPRVWIGTDLGLVLYDPASGGDAFGVRRVDARTVTYEPRWRYLSGARWIVPLPTDYVSSPIPRFGIASAANATTVLTLGGVAVLRSTSWTLAEKAAHYEDVLPRHDRYGLLADCGMASFGNLSGCENGPAESNSLWTGIQVVAEALRWNVTGDPDAHASLVHYAQGMQLLLNITGVSGLPARAVSGPSDPPQSGSWWHNSTVLPGWQWMGDTSSDSATGHLFTYALLLHVLGDAGTSAGINATALLVRIVSYIVANNFTLIDITGEPTRWGHWDPATINGNASWSDEHGVNAIEILAFLSAGLSLANPSSPEAGQFADAIAQLTTTSTHYNQNIINLNIEAPSDINYSDDQLEFFPYWMYCAVGAQAVPELSRAVQLSIGRTFAYVERWRPDIWILIADACNATTGWDGAALSSAMWWNLVTWPLELIDWPTRNSIRQDVVPNPESAQNGKGPTESVTVLPANERNQYRWNADPLTMDGGDGRSETEPGAWLLPYWLARYRGTLQ